MTASALPIPLCVVMESAINGLLALDEQARDNAKSLSGKTLQVILSDLGVTFYIGVTHQQDLQILSYAEQPDVVIRATSINLAKMSTMDDANRMVLNQDVTISGDVGTVSQVQAFFASVHIDWEEHLSRLTGDMIANKIGSSLRAGVAWLRGSAKSLAEDASEYARYEAQYLLDKQEGEDFVEQVNQLRNDVDRLEAKIKRLAHLLKTRSKTSS